MDKKIVSPNIWSQGRRSTAALLSGVLFFSAVAAPFAEAGFWEDRRRAAGRSTASPVYAQLPAASLNAVQQAIPTVTRTFPGTASPRLNAEDVPAWLAAVPSAYADIVSVHAGRPGAVPTVVLVQDAHDVATAQKSISRLLTALDEKSRVSGTTFLTGVEGTSGGFELGRFRPGLDPAGQAAVADYLLERAYINGPEHFGLTAKHEPLLWGVEDAAAYGANLRAYRSSLPIHDGLVAGLAQMARSAESLKGRFFSPDLAELDRIVDGWSREIGRAHV
jgi:hypothetical protein